VYFVDGRGWRGQYRVGSTGSLAQSGRRRDIRL